MTFTIKVRGAPSGLIARDFCCADHGPFEDLVPRDIESALCPDCAAPCPRQVSAPAVHTQFVVSATQGKSAEKPHRMSMDTRPLAEGQKYTEWRRERKKGWEEMRHKRVKDLLS